MAFNMKRLNRLWIKLCKEIVLALARVPMH